MRTYWEERFAAQLAEEMERSDIPSLRQLAERVNRRAGRHVVSADMLQKLFGPNRSRRPRLMPLIAARIAAVFDRRICLEMAGRLHSGASDDSIEQ